MLSLMDADRVFVAAARGPFATAGASCPWQWNFCGYSLISAQPEVLVVNDATKDARRALLPSPTLPSKGFGTVACHQGQLGDALPSFLQQCSPFRSRSPSQLRSEGMLFWIMHRSPCSFALAQHATALLTAHDNHRGTGAHSPSALCAHSTVVAAQCSSTAVLASESSSAIRVAQGRAALAGCAATQWCLTQYGSMRALRLSPATAIALECCARPTLRCSDTAHRYKVCDRIATMTAAQWCVRMLC